MTVALQGVRAVILGGTGGLGRAVARHFIDEGGQVVIVGRDAARTSSAAEMIYSGSTGHAYAVSADLARHDSGRYVVEQAVALLGGLDIVVSCASAELIVSDLESLALDDLRHAFEVKVWGPLAVVQAALPYLKQSPRASVVVVTGSSGRDPRAKTMQISMTNVALGAAARSLAHELAPAVKVVTVVPGAIRTSRWEAAVGSLGETAAPPAEGAVLDPMAVARSIALVASPAGGIGELEIRF